MEKAVENVLKTFDGVDKLSKEQVSGGNFTLYSGNNVIVLAALPTGFGRSLLFQLIPGLCVVLNRMVYPVYPKSPIIIVVFPPNAFTFVFTAVKAAVMASPRKQQDRFPP